jgi:hypothetical protein
MRLQYVTLPDVCDIKNLAVHWLFGRTFYSEKILCRVEQNSFFSINTTCNSGLGHETI